ncbi:MAG: tail fiber domain-containing protein [Heliobacteriaceae bacterium]|nr:tail fiber domain-containing protein [Heliobacteriaceae bacterium]
MKKKAFTLAEMMVVLLILSIVLAAFAPIMTRRSMAGKPYYWRSENNGAQIYYGTAAGNRVNIGQRNDTNDANSRLIINTGADEQNHILFKRSGTNLLGFLKLDTNDNLRIGGTPLTTENSNYGIHNTGIGIGSLQSLSTGQRNTAVGANAMYTNTTGYSNTALGYGTLYSNIRGTSNTAVGHYSLYTNTSGHYNTAIGPSSLYSNTTGSENTAFGYYSLHENTTGGYNTSIGDFSLRYNTTGYNTTAIGHYSMYSNRTGYNNTALGYYSLNSNTIGYNNTAIGYYACRYVNANGSNKTCIGNNSGPAYGTGDTTSTDNQMWLGTSETTVYIPGKLTVTGTTTGPSETWSTSDIRLKNVKGENKSGLEKIKQLKVFNYTFKDDKKKTPRVGVIAQDLQKIFPDAVTKDEKGYLLIRMEDMFYALVNAVKELDTKVNAALSQGKILKQVQNDMAAQDAKIKELEKTLKHGGQSGVQGAKIKELEERIQKLEAKLQ